MSDELRLSDPLPSGRLVIEASAGTGKTYSLSALVTRFVAERGVPVSELLLVTFTRAAANELRDRTRRVLVIAEAAVRTGTLHPDHPWMEVLLQAPPDDREVYARRLQEAVTTFDDATITTIHGFCQQALRQLGMRSGAALDRELADSTTELLDEVCRDLVVRELYRDASALSWTADQAAESILKQLVAAAKVVLGNPGSVIVPQGDEPGLAVPPPDQLDRLHRWTQLVDEAVELVGERRRARGEMGYDDLVAGLHQAVHHPVTGEAAASTLRKRSTLVLVDEFQDTDRVQWQTFERIFTDTDLVTVGDPKQAIYRFRGADVHAYLKATEGESTLRLLTNHRSDRLLVQATNALVRDVQLGDARIVAHDVGSRPSAPDSSIDAGAPVQLRCVPTHPSILDKKGVVRAPLVEDAVLADLVRVAVELMDHHHLTAGDTVVPLGPEHLAVLVPTNTLAEKVVDALVRARIPAVRAKTGSVLDTDATAQWDLLLAALEQPANAHAVRAAGFGTFMQRPVSFLDPAHAQADDHLAEMQQQCARWADDLSRLPLLAWYDRIRAERGLAAALLTSIDGERVLTDLDHIAELLAGELGGRGTTAAASRRALDRLKAAAATESDGPQMRRIDSDAAAVQVTTLHSSKGLEYPVVLLPFSYNPPYVTGPMVYNHPDGTRVIDIATGRKWSAESPELRPEYRSHRTDLAARGDQLRLLYVGLTRARHRTVVWWAPRLESKASALNRVLFDRDATGEPLNTTDEASLPEFMPVDDDDCLDQLQRLAARADESIQVVQCPVDQPVRPWVPAASRGQRPLPQMVDVGGRVVVDPAWRKWSFTGITRDRHDQWVPSMPQSGGRDEGDVEPAPVVAPTSPVPWADIVAGAAFGTLVHEVLELVDPTTDPLEPHLHDVVADRLRRNPVEVRPDELVAGLAAAIRTPLGPVVGGLRLADIPVTDRLAELDFDMPFGAVQPRVSAAQIGDVLLRTLPDDDPQRPYAATLADGRFPIDLAGFLHGQIDAVLRVHGPSGPRFVVVDYKTNRLHQRGDARPLDAYHPSLLPAAMATSDYPLQSLLYSVALHRFLAWRLGDAYDPAQHLGGIAYLFLRGMVGEQTPHVDGAPYGVFAWQPPAATVVALDRLFTAGVVA